MEQNHNMFMILFSLLRLGVLLNITPRRRRTQEVQQVRFGCEGADRAIPSIRFPFLSPGIRIRRLAILRFRGGW